MKHPLAEPKWTLPEASTTTRLTREALEERVRTNLEALAPEVTWEQLITTEWRRLFSEDDGRELGGQIFGRFREEMGRPYYAGCDIAVVEAPERYVMRSASHRYVDASEFPPGVVGDGDNVFEAQDVTGEVLLVSSVDVVERLVDQGVPDGVIGVIDDAGGTMTAPVLPDFEAVICLAGTVRSHLAIIAREFGVPTLMGARLSRPLVDGEVLTVSYSSRAQSVEAYLGEDMAARAHIREGRTS